MTGATAGSAHAHKLLMLLLDCVACAPAMDIIGDDDRLCEALQRLLKALCEALSCKLHEHPHVILNRLAVLIGDIVQCLQRRCQLC